MEIINSNLSASFFDGCSSKTSSIEALLNGLIADEQTATKLTGTFKFTTWVSIWEID